MTMDDDFNNDYQDDHATKSLAILTIYCNCTKEEKQDVEEKPKLSYHIVGHTQLVSLSQSCFRSGWKIGLCDVPPQGQPFSLLSLANNTCLKNSFTGLRDRFVKIYKRKAHVHHYTSVDGFEAADLGQSLESLSWLIDEYNVLDKQGAGSVDLPRLNVVASVGLGSQMNIMYWISRALIPLICPD